MQLVIDSMSDSYTDIIDTVLEHGDVSDPRGNPTTECLDFSLKLTDPTRSLPVNIGRELNTKIAAVEAVQLIGGVCDPQAMLRASKGFAPFMDGGTFHGGYGQRTRGQIPAMIRRLMTDTQTRQAVVTMWDPQHDLFTSDMRDYPCTIAMQFMVRKDKLVMQTHMRSNDVWRGLPYDVFVFTQLQLAIAAALSLEAGAYYHHVSSMHVYHSDFNAIDTMRTHELTLPLSQSIFPAYVISGVGFEASAEIARRLLADEPLSEEMYEICDRHVLGWYRSRLAKPNAR